MTRIPLALPVRGTENGPTYDAHNRLVSISEHADLFAHALNNHQRLLDALRAVMPLLEQNTPEYVQALRALDDARPVKTGIQGRRP